MIKQGGYSAHRSLVERCGCLMSVICLILMFEKSLCHHKSQTVFPEAIYFFITARIAQVAQQMLFKWASQLGQSGHQLKIAVHTELNLLFSSQNHHILSCCRMAVATDG